MKPFKISEAIKGKYRVLTHLPRLIHPTGTFDFRTMTEEQAEALIEAGTQYLVKINKRKAVS